MKYKPHEKKQMIEKHFPLCYAGRHCSSCIKNFRKMKKIYEKEINKTT